MKSGEQFGEYTLQRSLGVGGQGEVFEARDTLGLTWALKIGHRVHTREQAALVRFAREAQWVNATFGALPRNCGILVGEHYGVFDQRFYVKMRLVKGESLAQRLPREGALPASEAVALARKLAETVAIAHDNKAVHRDLKPENVLLEDGGGLQVVDWGCLHLVEASQSVASAAGPLCTLGYAAPEQYDLKTNATPQADIYALGVILFEMLTGYNPFLDSWRNRRGVNVPPNTHDGVTRTMQREAQASTTQYPTANQLNVRDALPDAVTRATQVTEIIGREEQLVQQAQHASDSEEWRIDKELRPRSVTDVVRRQLAFSWASLGPGGARIDSALVDVLTQMLQPERAQRPSSLVEVASRLAAVSGINATDSDAGRELNRRIPRLGPGIVAALLAVGVGLRYWNSSGENRANADGVAVGAPVAADASKRALATNLKGAPVTAARAPTILLQESRAAGSTAATDPVTTLVTSSGTGSAAATATAKAARTPKSGRKSKPASVRQSRGQNVSPVADTPYFGPQ